MAKKINISLVSLVTVGFFLFLPFERLLTSEILGFTLKISFALLMVLVLIFLLRAREYRLEVEEKLLLLFALLSYLSIFWSIDQYRSMMISTIFLAVFLGFIALKKFVGEKEVLIIEKIIIWSGVALALFALWQYFTDLYGLSNWTFLRDVYNKSVFGFPRPQATFLEPLYLANYLFLPFYLSIKRFVKSNKFDWLSFVSLFLTTISFVLTLSRGAYIGLILSLVVLVIFIFVKFKNYWRKILFSVGIIIIGIVCAVLIIKLSAPRESFELFVTHAGVADASTGESTLDRFYLSKLAWQQFLNHPWGIGAGAFGALPEFSEKVITGDYQTVNNLYLEILVEEGFLGFLFFVLFLFLLIKNLLIRSNKKNIDSLFYLVVGVAIFAQAVSFSSLYILPIWGYLALAWSGSKAKM